MLRNAISVIVWMGACLLAASYPAPGQQTTTANQVSTPPKFGCRHRADPHRRRHSCDDVDFGLDETLGGGWKEIRRATQRIGITPTASYIGALQTNVTGGHDQVWSYAGLFSLAASVDFSELIKARGLSAYVGQSHGADFTLQEGNKGVLAIAEIDYLHNQQASSVGKPGQITAGFVHSNNSFPSLSSPLEHSDGYSGAYLMGQQMVFQPDGPGTSRGATAWAAWALNSKQLVSPIPVFWGAGLSYEGLIRPRKNDIVSVGLIRSEASKYASPTNAEELLELNYQWSHSRFLTITPHAQYLWKGQNRDGRNATVIGIQLALTL